MNCRLALIIGLAIRNRLSKFLSDKIIKIDIFIKHGFHRLEDERNFVFDYLLFIINTIKKKRNNYDLKIGIFRKHKKKIILANLEDFYIF